MTVPDDVPEQTVRDLATVLRPLGPLDRVELLTGGMFATTYRATLGDGTRVVVKTAPTDTDRLLRYEHDLLRTEAAVYSLAADRPDLLMPRVLLTDLSRTVLASDVLVVSHLDGVPLVDAGELEPAVADTVQRQLGAFMARLHTVHGERFGYPNLDAGLHAATWTEAFGRMVEALLDDAGRWGTPLPSDEVRAALDRHRAALDDIRVPSLVHTDLWAGNLFVDPSTGTLVGVIDTERSVWGDPLLELAGADQLGRGLAPAALLDGYAAAGGTLELETASGGTRLDLYRLYMCLVLLVEIAPRGYVGDWLAAHRSTAAANLRAALDALA
ncbi:MAG TPA: phosphotransferase [Cellulomonas sp.]|nr:phosphotransferase [Cellulomonas sp.]